MLAAGNDRKNCGHNQQGILAERVEVAGIKKTKVGKPCSKDIHAVADLEFGDKLLKDTLSSSGNFAIKKNVSQRMSNKTLQFMINT